MKVELNELSELVKEVSSLDDTVLGHAIRRVQHETEEGRDPVAAFGAFNQHSSSPW